MKKPNNRRKFLRNGGLLAAAGMSGQLSAMKTSSSSGRRKDIVGHNGFTYQVDKEWGVQDASKYPVDNCHEMVMDDQGRIFMLNTEKKNNILIYSKDGKVLDHWTHDLPEPHGLTISGEGKDQTLWITDSAVGRVMNCRLDGRIIRELVVPEGVIPADKNYKPTETTVAPNGDVYVADGYGSNLILQYDAKGQFKQSFGGDKHFSCAHGITYDHRSATPSLLITSRAANNFQRWTLDGKHLETFELPGLSICRPVIHGAETYFAVIVTKSWGAYDGMVAVLDKDMKVVSLPGGSAPPAEADFKEVIHDGKTFLNPHDVCLDEDDNIYIPQWYSGRTYPLKLKRV